MVEEEGHAVLEIHPKEIKGSWDAGYVLDQHTISSTMIGYNEFGHPEFDTQRSPLGELVYRLKYRNDKTTIPSIIATVSAFLKTWGIEPQVIVPMPPSKLRSFQPVAEIASHLSRALDVPLDAATLKKTGTTSQMKDIGDYSERVRALEAVFTVGDSLEGKRLLLVDDLYQSGASMDVAARTLKKDGSVGAVYAIALTRTRN
jgi:predicted amidophosphoribosyltransferase